MSDTKPRRSESSSSASRFDGRVALVSGGGSGIGLAFARGFTQEGGRVAILGRTENKLSDACVELNGGHSQDDVVAMAIVGRHESTDDAERAVREVAARWGRLDVLFNNAGTYDPGSVAETSDESWNGALDANLSGPFRLTRAALPLLRTHRGVVINNSSTLGLKPIAGAAAYAVAKAGLTMLTRATALEEAPNGVRVNAICPGVVDTPIHEQRVGSDPESRSSFLQQAGKFHPLGRVGSADEVAAMALFLASDASAWTTGAVITVDGGILLA